MTEPRVYVVTNEADRAIAILNPVQLGHKVMGAIGKEILTAGKVIQYLPESEALDRFHADRSHESRQLGLFGNNGAEADDGLDAMGGEDPDLEAAADAILAGETVSPCDDCQNPGDCEGCEHHQPEGEIPQDEVDAWAETRAEEGEGADLEVPAEHTTPEWAPGDEPAEDSTATVTGAADIPCTTETATYEPPAHLLAPEEDPAF